MRINGKDIDVCIIGIYIGKIIFIVGTDELFDEIKAICGLYARLDGMPGRYYISNTSSRKFRFEQI